MTRPGLINMELFFLDAMSCRLSAKNSCPSRKRMRRSPEKKKKRLLDRCSHSTAHSTWRGLGGPPPEVVWEGGGGGEELWVGTERETPALHFP